MSRKNDTPVVLFVATYDNRDDAKSDFESIGQIGRNGTIGQYEAALITRDYYDRVHIKVTEKLTEHGATAGRGLVVPARGDISAIVGAFFPPYLLNEAALSALDGNVIGHVRDGLPREDLKEIARELNEGTAAVVILGKSVVERSLQGAITRASKEIAKVIASGAKEFDREFETIADEASSAL